MRQNQNADKGRKNMNTYLQVRHPILEFCARVEHSSVRQRAWEMEKMLLSKLRNVPARESFGLCRRCKFSL